MIKMWYLAIFVIFSLTLLVYFFFYRTAIKNISKVEIKGKMISVDIADTEAKRMKGLMFRKQLAENSGMIFVFPNSNKYSFWMANTFIPLDIIWIDENFKIVFINPNTPSCEKTGTLSSLCQSYTPHTKARYVLEVNSGWCEKNKIVVGDVVSFN